MEKKETKENGKWTNKKNMIEKSIYMYIYDLSCIITYMSCSFAHILRVISLQVSSSEWGPFYANVISFVIRMYCKLLFFEAFKAHKYLGMSDDGRLRV